jgi:hypothetical protein
MMITENEYRQALETVHAYRKQVEQEIALLDMPCDPLKLLRKGQQIKLTKTYPNSKYRAGDVVSVHDCFFTDKDRKWPHVILINARGTKTHFTKEYGAWDYEVVRTLDT